MTDYDDWLKSVRENCAHFGKRDLNCDVPWPFLVILIAERDKGFDLAPYKELQDMRQQLRMIRSVLGVKDNGENVDAGGGPQASHPLLPREQERQASGEGDAGPGHGVSSEEDRTSSPQSDTPTDQEVSGGQEEEITALFDNIREHGLVTPWGVYAPETASPPVPTVHLEEGVLTDEKAVDRPRHHDPETPLASEEIEPLHSLPDGETPLRSSDRPEGATLEPTPSVSEAKACGWCRSKYPRVVGPDGRTYHSLLEPAGEILCLAVHPYVYEGAART